MGERVDRILLFSFKRDLSELVVVFSLMCLSIDVTIELMVTPRAAVLRAAGGFV